MLFLFKYEKLPVYKISNYEIKMKAIMLIAMVFLSLEEYRPTLASSKIFDYWNITFSAAGLMLFYIVYRKLKTKKLK
jgi:hypothetical protein